MCDRLNFETVEEFFSHYTQNPVPEWLIPFSITKTDDTDEQYPVMVVRESELRFNLVTRYAPDKWNFPQAIPVPYIPGKISCVEVGEGLWAISSKFSGCSMAAFSLKDNPQSRYVCHIANGDGGCGSELYDAFRNNESIERLCIFEPYDIAGTDYVKAIDKNYYFKWQDFYGLITGSNECYTFIIGKKDGKRRIVAWVKWGFDSQNKQIPTQGFPESNKSKCGCVIL